MHLVYYHHVIDETKYFRHRCKHLGTLGHFWHHSAWHARHVLFNVSTAISASVSHLLAHAGTQESWGSLDMRFGRLPETVNTSVCRGEQRDDHKNGFTISDMLFSFNPTCSHWGICNGERFMRKWCGAWAQLSLVRWTKEPPLRQLPVAVFGSHLVTLNPVFRIKTWTWTSFACVLICTVIWMLHSNCKCILKSENKKNLSSFQVALVF